MGKGMNDWTTWLPEGRWLDSDPPVYYGCAIPLQLRLERALKNMQERANYSRMHPEPIIVHPAVWQRWIDEGIIDKEGNWIGR